MARVKKKWNYRNLNHLIDMVANRIKKEKLSQNGAGLSKICRQEIANGYYYGYARCLPEEQIPKSVDAVEAMVNFIVSYQKPSQILERHGSSMKFNAEVIICARYRLAGEHGISIVEEYMTPSLRFENTIN
tara:strand:- start:35 stop:427 length:393 start_codon:yes stop_codon:yes gene_type:complete